MKTPTQKEARELRKAKAELTFFYALLGQCINWWTQVDELLCECCEFGAGTDGIRAAVIFYFNHGFGRRLQLIDKLMVHALKSDAHKATWRDLHIRLNDMAGFRNFITHHPANQGGSVQVRFNRRDGTARITKQSSWWEVRTARREVQIGKRQDKAFTVGDLTKHQHELDVIQDDLGKFLAQVGARGWLILGPARPIPPSSSGQASRDHGARSKRKRPPGSSGV